MALTKLMVKTHEITFQNCLRLCSFPFEWKRTNVVPTFKKYEKQCIKNSRPVCLHPICGKVNGYFITTCFHLLSENKPNTVKTIWIQTRLFLYQRVTIYCTRNLLAFADDLEVRGVFLGISKTFDRVWHEDLLYNLQKNGILGELITLITDFLELLKR